MKGFFDSLKGDNNNNNNSNKKNNNLLAGLGFTNKKPSRGTSGGGQSLGGVQPGIVLSMQLSEPGSLGVKVEKRPNALGTAIVAMVIPDSQAERAGLQRGDIVCFPNSNGQEEMTYDLFIELAKSTQRPLCFDVRRIPIQNKKKTNEGTETAADKNTSSSAEAYARKQAVIAAAEKREKAHKLKTTGSNPAKKAALLSKQQALNAAANAAAANNTNKDADVPQSEQARAAIEAAKLAEAATAAQLGYNPYETNRLTAGQARNAITSGNTSSTAMAAASTPSTTLSSKNNPTQHVLQQQQSVAPPVNALIPEVEEEEDVEIDARFAQAFERLVTANPNQDDASIKTSLGILIKLIMNATTRSDPKFHRIRLTNPKIKAAVVDLEGALEILLSVGFELTTTTANDDVANNETVMSEESVLVYPYATSSSSSSSSSTMAGPAWLPKALAQMEAYEKS